MAAKLRKGDSVVVIAGKDKGKKGDRVGIRTLADGRRVRFFKSNDEVVDA